MVYYLMDLYIFLEALKLLVIVFKTNCFVLIVAKCLVFMFFEQLCNTYIDFKAEVLLKNNY